MQSPELAQLSGQIEGAIGVLKWGLSVVGSLLVLVLGLVTYVFTKLDKKVEGLSSKAHKLANDQNTLGGRVIKLETWREFQEQRAAEGK